MQKCLPKNNCSYNLRENIMLKALEERKVQCLMINKSIDNNNNIQQSSHLKILQNIEMLREAARRNHLDNIIHSLVKDKIIIITKTVSFKFLSKIDPIITTALIELNFILKLNRWHIMSPQILEIYRSSTFLKDLHLYNKMIVL